MTTTIYKQLAGLQDLALGIGKENQSRNGMPVQIDKVSLTFQYKSYTDMLTAEGLAAQVGSFISSGSTVWKVDTSGSVLLASGLYATPVTSIYANDFTSAQGQTVIDISASSRFPIVGKQLFEGTQFILKEHLSISCAQFGDIEFRQLAGSNVDFVLTENYSLGNDVDNVILLKVQFNGNYFTDGTQWNDSSPILGNTSGDLVKVRGRGLIFDLYIYNTPGVGFYSDDTAPENTAAITPLNFIALEGKDYGKEGAILKGPNDWILGKCFLGRAGILPRPSAESSIAMSTEYPGEAVDGLVLDGINVEIQGPVHVYANWSGTGFRTRNTVRLTCANPVISESCRAQVNISEGTYGSCDFDIRNLSLVHPNWSATIPTYSFPDAEFDGCTINALQDFISMVTCKRTITAFTRVIGTTACVVNGAPEVKFNYSNSNAPSGDPEFGSRYSGRGIAFFGNNGCNARVNGRASNGELLHVAGFSANIDFSAYDCSKALVRDSVGNSKRGNNIKGTIRRCDIGFESIGTPTSENISLTMELESPEVPFIGDPLNVFSRMQVWDISATVSGTRVGTRGRYSAALDETTDAEQLIVIPHNFLFTPYRHQVALSIYDPAIPSANLDYYRIHDIDATNLTVKVKFSVAGPSGDTQLIAQID